MNDLVEQASERDNLSKKLAEILDELDQRPQPISEHEVSSKIKALKELDTENNSLAFIAEVLAFDFMEKYPHEKWGTYFGPMMEWSDKAKTSTFSYPDIAQINLEIIRYWEGRLSKTQNPVLKARYSGLIWDFSQKVINQKPSYIVGQTYVEALLLIAENNLQDEFQIYPKIERAIEY